MRSASAMSGELPAQPLAHLAQARADTRCCRTVFVADPMRRFSAKIDSAALQHGSPDPQTISTQ